MTSPQPRRIGRPPSEAPRSVRIDVPLTEAERSLIVAAAEASGATPTAFVRGAALRAAKRTKAI